MHETVFPDLLAAACLAAILLQTLFLSTRRLRAATGPRIPEIDCGILRRTHFLAHDVSPGGGHPPGGAAGPGSRRSTLAAAGDWLVPAIVWILVILMGAAVVGFLLGNQ